MRGSSAPARGWPAALLLAAALTAVLLAVGSAAPLQDRDEPRFAQATVEMLHSGDYLVPTFNGRLRADKPPLAYWAMAVPVRRVGPREWAFRAPSALGLALAALALYGAGRRLLGHRAGLLAATVLAATPLALVIGSAATADGLLLAFTTLAMALFTHAWLTGWRPLHAPALAVAFGGALLAKGPVGLALPLAGMLTAWGLDRRAMRLAGRHLLFIAVAALAGAGFFLLWALPANEATAGELARLGLGHQVVARSLRPLEGHGGPYLLGLFFYPVAALVTFFPWTLYLPAAISAVAGGRVGGASGRALLAGWVLPTFAIMTLVATKLPHYVLPAWPGLALAVGGTIEAAERGALTHRDRRWLDRGPWLFAPAGLALGVALAAAPWWLGLPSLRGPLGALGLAIGVLTVLGLALHRRGRVRQTVAALLGGWVALVAVLGVWVLPAVGRLEVSRPLARAIRRATPSGVPVATLGYDEPSLVFYLGRWPVEELAGESEAVAWARCPGPGVLVLPRSELAALRRRPGLPALQEVAAVSGLDLVKGRRLELVAVRRPTSASGTDPSSPRAKNACVSLRSDWIARP